MKPQQKEPIYVILGAKLSHIRNAVGKTQDDVAKMLGQTRANIANIEAGRQRIMLHDIDAFALVLGTTPKHIMRGIWT